MHDLDIMRKIIKNINEVGDPGAPAAKMNTINQKGVVDAQSNRVMAGQKNTVLRAAPTASLTQPVIGTPEDEKKLAAKPGAAASAAAAGGPTPPTQAASNAAIPTQVGVAAGAAGAAPNSPAAAAGYGAQPLVAGDEGDWQNDFLSELEEIAKDVAETHPHPPRASVPRPPKTPQSDLSTDLNRGIDQFKQGLGQASNFLKGRDWNKDAEDVGKFGKDLMGRLRGMGKSFQRGLGNPERTRANPGRRRQ